MSNNPAATRAQLTRLASSTNPEIAALARIMQSLVPQARAPVQQTRRTSNIQGSVEIDDKTVIAKSALNVDYQVRAFCIAKGWEGFSAFCF